MADEEKPVFMPKRVEALKLVERVNAILKDGNGSWEQGAIAQARALPKSAAAQAEYLDVSWKYGDKDSPSLAEHAKVARQRIARALVAEAREKRDRLFLDLAAELDKLALELPGVITELVADIRHASRNLRQEIEDGAP